MSLLPVQMVMVGGQVPVRSQVALGASEDAVRAQGQGEGAAQRVAASPVREGKALTETMARGERW